MVWLDRHNVSVPDKQVFCALRDGEVTLEKCLSCQWLVSAEPAEAPTYVVCDGYAVTGWLGFGADV